jgi:isoleucyl-tRNA synthetase
LFKIPGQEIGGSRLSVFQEVDPKTPVNQRESRVLSYWQDRDIAKKSVSMREGQPRFIFYEGPPTANGIPGIHHVLSRTIKDIACRYKTMQGYQVSRKAGWDTHGLPVEIEVEKRLGLSSKKEIEDYGIERFNEQCRESVFSYEREWRRLTERIGYWIDMDNPYVTLDNDYIETVWWILKQYFEAGLIYEGHKILPYCPRCGTPLASHEVAQGYRDEAIDSIYVKMKVKGKNREYLLVWTTTPWTLPSNVAIAANPESTYVRAQLGDEIYYLVEERVEPILGKDAKILSRVKGRDLEFLEYEQLLPFAKVQKKAFFVVLADFVSTMDGTGLVHIAPAYGEDDYRVGQEYDLPMLHLVNEEGRFVPEVAPWAGEFVKQADPQITRALSRENKLLKREHMVHSYPHCWRCDTPLLYYARKSWYIATTKYRDRMIAANQKVTWYPQHVGTGRFGDWLENMVDWALSRNRYWGTPLNIWKCTQCGKLESIGSREELSARAVEAVDPTTVDLHRPFVDDIHLQCSCGGLMSRTPEVIDCWFDSGAMPYGQMHYPFEHKDDFHLYFPADFIAEGLDQTRGWFYSLMAISTFLFDQSAFKSVLVNDLVLDKDGSKMSKSKGNTVDPWEMIDRFGVDALRWYFMAVSPPWVPTRFDPEGIKEIAVRFLGTLDNVYAFFTLYANIDNLDPKDISIPVEKRPEIDRWIISRLNSLTKDVREYMEAYDFTKTTRAISGFVVDEVSNWFVRRSRERFWSTDFGLDKKSAYRTLYEVLLTVSKLMAPFAPFAAEDIYLNLTGGTSMESVHLEDYPSADEEVIDLELQERMALVMTLVSLGRAVRNKVQIKVRQPLRKMLVNGKHRRLLTGMEDLVREELNVKEVVYVDDLQDYVLYEAKPNLPVAGPKFGKRLGGIMKALSSLDASEIAKSLESSGQAQIEVGDETIRLAGEDVEIRIRAREGFAIEMEKDVFVILDTEIDEALALEGIAREIVSKVQTMRKNLGFNVLDNINMDVACDDVVKSAIALHEAYIKGDTLCRRLQTQDLPRAASDAVSGDSGDFQAWDINGHQVLIRLERIPAEA